LHKACKVNIVINLVQFLEKISTDIAANVTYDHLNPKPDNVYDQVAKEFRKLLCGASA